MTEKMKRVFRVISFALLITFLIVMYRYSRHTDLKKVSETMTSMDQIRRALELYADQNDGLYPPPPLPKNLELKRKYHPENFEPRGKYFGIPPAAWPIGKGRQAHWLKHYLSPKYIKVLPLNDHWGNPMLCEVTPDRRHHTILSLGSDGNLDVRLSESWRVTETEHDLILSDGSFVSAPEGAVR